MKFTVGLDAYEVFAIHGYYDEEHVEPQPFVVSLKVEFCSENGVNDLEQTIDYGELQRVVDHVFLEGQQPIRLLEHLGRSIIEELKQTGNIQLIWIRIEKPNAPLPHPGGLPYIEMQWKKENQT
jgi:dihydroneopterin aldolase